MKWVSLQRLTYTLQKIEARYALQTHSHPSVTTNTFGFMSPADKVKLNGIFHRGQQVHAPILHTKAVRPVQSHGRYIWACERGGSGCKG